VDFLRLNHLLNRRVCPFPREREEKVGAGGRMIMGGIEGTVIVVVFSSRRKTYSGSSSS